MPLFATVAFLYTIPVNRPKKFSKMTCRFFQFSSNIMLSLGKEEPVTFSLNMIYQNLTSEVT